MSFLAYWRSPNARETEKGTEETGQEIEAWQKADRCLYLRRASKNRVETKKVIAKGWENEYKR